ncbi:MAG: SUMF1/EgtB/PvdO family nonheme iron enzyme [Verrucomicrobia bacterium]|nr:SUMF1/EgtB/PvdO family nonheme iron enzyme [Verrucomicrobiota bacterium]
MFSLRALTFAVAITVPPALVAGEPTAHSQTSDSFTIAAWAFDRGNAKTFTREWADAGPMVAFGGHSPVVVEYDIEFPVTEEYGISVLYAASDPRPVKLFLDGHGVGECCRSTTGSWNTSNAKWESAGRVAIAQGKHTVKLERANAFPHVVSLRFESPTPLPTEWTLNRPKARQLTDPPPVAPGKPWTQQVNFAALRRAIEDLTRTSGPSYPRGSEFLARLDRLERRASDEKRGNNLPPPHAQSEVEENSRPAEDLANQAQDLMREALLANPLLDFDQLLLIRRRADKLGLPANWQSNSSLPRTGYDHEIATLNLHELRTHPERAPVSQLATLYQPEDGKFVGDLKLHFDADRLMFSSIGTHDRWQVFELALAEAEDLAANVRQVTPGDQPDVDNYDACYLPAGRVIFCSTASFTGVPCVDGSDHVATLYLLERDGKTIRQLGFDQDHNWSPTVLNDGRVLYQRWEYADIPHSNSRLLFRMNPDGTGQEEFYGSNSYWPNAMFYARPIPAHPTKVAAIVTGHHGVPRMGELVLFDVAQGRQETGGVVQRIPGFGKRVERIYRDQLVDDSWPKFLHPAPLSEKYFIVSAKPAPDARWGVYLVDIFDNLLLLAERPGQALLEPIPLRRTPRPPIIPDRVDLARQDGLVYLTDIYQGDGLKGVPRGTVKALRVLSYHWAYQGMGGLLGTVGLDGPWDIRRILGTVPVEADGSAFFRAPANTPISVQPLDAEGKAIQLMRSWFTAMPGENLSCVGCHEKQNRAPAGAKAAAFKNRVPSEIKPWHGPPRGFSYAREVQPVIDAHCVRCHDDQTPPDLRGTENVNDFKLTTPGHAGRHGGKFSVGYASLHRYVRRPGIESDYHLLAPLEYHADTTELVQLLRKGHHGVQLGDEDWGRLVTWIDLNAPYHGSWGEEIGDPGWQSDRRRELRKLYAGMDDEDAEAIVAIGSVREAAKPAFPLTPALSPGEREVRSPSPENSGVAASSKRSTHERDRPSVHPPPGGEGRGEGNGDVRHLQDWIFDAAEAARRQTALGGPTRRTVELGNGITLELVLIPAGEFLMGDANASLDERPLTRVHIAEPFWMGGTEISNEQFARFDSAHDSHVESKTAYQFGIHGIPVNEPQQPVVRVSWEHAMAFCRWLSHKTGQHFSLPTEAQWEYACRAGADTPFSFGAADADFSRHANLADAKLTEFASDPYTVCVPLQNPTKYEDYIPKDTRWNDGGLVSVRVGNYAANAWGLHDLHGNVSEWTRTSHRPYPYRDNDGRNDLAGAEKKIVRGGSWRDQPARATSAYRLAYAPWQGVFNVGFRVVCDTKTDGAQQNAAR